MTNYANIARPYAKAAFEYARDQQEIASWRAFLTAAALIATHADVARLLVNPAISSKHILELFEEVLANNSTNEQRNFLRLLAIHQRLLVVPHITDLFEASCAALDSLSTVKVITAIEITDDYQQKLAQAIKQRINHDVILECEVNPAILGGAQIHIGDRVIDGSIRGKLSRLLEFSLR